MSPKEKGVAKKWMSKVCGKDVTVKDKVECIITFALHDLPEKKNTEDLEKKNGTRNARARINENE